VSFADPKTGVELASSSATVGADCFQKLKAMVDLATVVFRARELVCPFNATMDELDAILKARDALRDCLARS
jgi:hypothetical protein